MSRARYISILIGKIAVTVGLFVFLSFTVVGEYKKAQLYALNHYMPRSYGYLLEVPNLGTLHDKTKLDRYLFYYKIASRYMPKRSDVHELLGFCYYYRGERVHAISNYKKAIELNPQFFWSHYNLGVIYFKEGEYTQTLESLKKAFQTQPVITIQYIYASKVYRDIIKDIRGRDYEPDTSLKEAYQNARLMAVASATYIKSPKAKSPLSARLKNISLQIF